jgi:hypothetical protein
MRPQKKTISVNRQALQRGEPGLSLKMGGMTIPTRRVVINGPSEVIHDPDKKRQPRAWIETYAPVEYDE